MRNITSSFFSLLLIIGCNTTKSGIEIENKSTVEFSEMPLWYMDDSIGTVKRSADKVVMGLNDTVIPKICDTIYVYHNHRHPVAVAGVCPTNSGKFVLVDAPGLPPEIIKRWFNLDIDSLSWEANDSIEKSLDSFVDDVRRKMWKP